MTSLDPLATLLFPRWKLQPATLKPAGRRFSPAPLQGAVQGGVPLLRGEEHVLAELIGMLALFPALRHRLSILQQKIEVAELREGGGGCHLTECPPPTGSRESEWEAAAAALI